MTTNRHKYFRFNPRTARLTIIYAMVVPAIFGVMAYQTDVSLLTRLNGSTSAQERGELSII